MKTISLLPSFSKYAYLFISIPFLSCTKVAIDTSKAKLGNGANSTENPANILNLTNWKLTVPIDANNTQLGLAKEISQPQLATYSLSPYFLNNSTNTGVIFQANTGGATTSGSGNPRSELREMTNNGTDRAAWSVSSGINTIIIDQAITHLPTVKNHIVAGQVHGDDNNTGPDGNDDVIVLRLEGSKLFLNHNGKAGATITNNYVLGTRFIFKIIATGGKFYSYYNGTLVETYIQAMNSGYFKAGAYVQSSCKSGGKPGPSELCNAYGEVVIYNLTVTHE